MQYILKPAMWQSASNAAHGGLPVKQSFIEKSVVFHYIEKYQIVHKRTIYAFFK